MTKSDTCQLCGSPLAYSVCPKCPSAFQAALLASGRWTPARPDETLQTILTKRKKVSASELVALTTPPGLFDDVSNLASYVSRPATLPAGLSPEPFAQFHDKEEDASPSMYARPLSTRPAAAKITAEPTSAYLDLFWYLNWKKHDDLYNPLAPSSEQPPVKAAEVLNPQPLREIPFGVTFWKTLYSLSPTEVLSGPISVDHLKSTTPTAKTTEPPQRVAGSTPASTQTASSPRAEGSPSHVPTWDNLEALQYASGISQAGTAQGATAVPLTTETLQRRLDEALAPIAARLDELIDKLDTVPRDKGAEQAHFLLRSAESITLNLFSSFIYDLLKGR